MVGRKKKSLKMKKIKGGAKEIMKPVVFMYDGICITKEKDLYTVERDNETKRSNFNNFDLIDESKFEESFKEEDKVLNKLIEEIKISIPKIEFGKENHDTSAAGKLSASAAAAAGGKKYSHNKKRTIRHRRPSHTRQQNVKLNKFSNQKGGDNFWLLIASTTLIVSGTSYLYKTYIKTSDENSEPDDSSNDFENSINSLIQESNILLTQTGTLIERTKKSRDIQRKKKLLDLFINRENILKERSTAERFQDSHQRRIKKYLSQKEDLEKLQAILDKS